MMREEPESTTRYPFSIIRQRLREHAGKVLDFALGQHSVNLPDRVLEFINKQTHLALKRGNRDEMDSFSESAVEMLSREYSIQVTRDCVLPAPGGRYAMTVLAATLLNPGDGVLVTEPGYPAFAYLAAKHHGRIHVAVLDPDREFAPDLGALPEDVVKSIKIAALNYPNNPTGACLSNRITGVLGKALDPEAVLFNDATYGPLVYDQPPVSLLGIRGPGGFEQQALELHSLSKLFALGPQASSFFVGPASLIQTIRDFSEYAWSPISSMRLQVGRLCMQDAEYYKNIRASFCDRISRLRSTLEQIGFQPHPTPAGVYVLCRVPRAIRGKVVISAQQAADALLDEHGVAVAAWDTPPRGYLRFTALYREEDLEDLAKLGSPKKLASS